MKISIRKLTDSRLLRDAASITTGKLSKISLLRAYTLGHSLMRTQLFWIELRNIPLCVASHLVRHVHAQPYQLSKRVDRGGANFTEVVEIIDDKIRNAYNGGSLSKMWEAREELRNLPNQFDRLQPTDLGLLLNAEEIINISRLRLCMKASKETRNVWREVVTQLKEVDPALYLFCVPSCVHQGFCREEPTCGYCATANARAARNNYLKLFDK